VYSISKPTPREMHLVGAQLALSPTFKAAANVRRIGGSTVPVPLEITALVQERTAQVREMRDGNLARQEEVLIAQALTLDALFRRYHPRPQSKPSQCVNQKLSQYIRDKQACAATFQANPRKPARRSSGQYPQTAAAKSA
jgi:hypothetical protein